MLNRLVDYIEQYNQSPWERLRNTFVLMLSTMGLYLLINYNQASEIDLLMPLDQQIPYWPWTISIYVTLYIMYLTAAIVLTPRHYAVMLISVLWLALFSFACFILFTSHYPRPDPSEWAHSVWKPLIDFMVSIDPPGNTCPSLHVSTSLYVGWSLRQSRLGGFWLLWALLVSLSTLTLKQHFVWDWICGTLLVIVTVLGEKGLQLFHSSPEEIDEL